MELGRRESASPANTISCENVSLIPAVVLISLVLPKYDDGVILFYLFCYLLLFYVEENCFLGKFGPFLKHTGIWTLLMGICALQNFSKPSNCFSFCHVRTINFNAFYWDYFGVYVINTKVVQK